MYTYFLLLDLYTIAYFKEEAIPYLVFNFQEISATGQVTSRMASGPALTSNFPFLKSLMVTRLKPIRVSAAEGSNLPNIDSLIFQLVDAALAVKKWKKQKAKKKKTFFGLNIFNISNCIA